MKRHCQHEVIDTLASSPTDPIRLDSIIRLTSKKGAVDYPKTIRKVCYHDDEYDRDYVFITNSFNVSAQEIANIYKSRWQVELFFKWIKQNLKIRTFWGTSKNAVFIQIWTALIVSLLIWIHKALNEISVSPQRLVQILKTTLLSRNTIVGLFDPGDLPLKPVSYQLVFKGPQF